MVTKTDRVPPVMLELHQKHTLAKLQRRVEANPMAWPHLGLTSATQKTGLIELQCDILSVCGLSK